jgi:hypothetical protein
LNVNGTLSCSLNRTAAPDEEIFPTGHLRHCVCPLLGWYSLAKQGTHAVLKKDEEVSSRKYEEKLNLL